jgi:ribonuclease P protein component
MRVRRTGRSFADPLVVLVALPNDQGPSRFAVSAGRRIGNAVQRNRAKRLIREAVRAILQEIKPGWDVVLVARRPLPEAKFYEVEAAVRSLFSRANLLEIR